MAARGYEFIFEYFQHGEQLKEKRPGKVNSRKTLFAKSSTVSDSSDAESGIAGIETF